MNAPTSLVVTLLVMATFLWALFYAVMEGMQIALRKDLLDQRDLSGDD